MNCDHKPKTCWLVWQAFSSQLNFTASGLRVSLLQAHNLQGQFAQCRSKFAFLQNFHTALLCHGNDIYIQNVYTILIDTGQQYFVTE